MPFKLQAALQERAEAGLLRQRVVLQSGQSNQIQVNGQQYLNFSSNDYLGLAGNPQIVDSWQKSLAQWGCGAGASPLVTGYTEAHAKLEKDIAQWLDVEAVMLFSTGFAANQAVIKALLHKEHVQWQDRLNHASLQEAGAHSPASMKRFRHNDMSHLQSLLQPQSGLIITEGVFSMDGDQAPLSELAQLAHASGNWLMVDDAHGLGVLGSEGQGTLSHQGVASNQIHIRMATFGKAVGLAGAFVAGSRTLIDYLINFARDYVYSTHMPAAQAAALSTAIQVVRESDERRLHLQALIRHFREQVSKLNFTLGDSETAIQPLIVGDAKEASALAETLRSQGVWVSAIRPPTVPMGTARLRLTLTANHSFAEIDRLVQCLKAASTCKSL